MGRLAKTDRIDAETLALFAEKVRPRPTTKRPEKQVELDALVTRRRQLVSIRAIERNRQPQAATQAARRSILKLIEVLDKQIAALDKAIAKLIESDDDWSARCELLESVPGIGPTSSATLVAELPELGQLAERKSRPWPDSRPSTTIVADTADNDISAVAAPRCVRPYSWPR